MSNSTDPVCTGLLLPCLNGGACVQQVRPNASKSDDAAAADGSSSNSSSNGTGLAPAFNVWACACPPGWRGAQCSLVEVVTVAGSNNVAGTDKKNKGLWAFAALGALAGLALLVRRNRIKESADLGDFELPKVVGGGGDGWLAGHTGGPARHESAQEFSNVINLLVSSGYGSPSPTAIGSFSPDGYRRYSEQGGEIPIMMDSPRANTFSPSSGAGGAGAGPTLTLWRSPELLHGRSPRGIPAWWNGDDDEYLSMDGATRAAERARRGLPEMWEGDEYLGVDGVGGVGEGPSRSHSYENALDTVGLGDGGGGGLSPLRALPSRGSSIRIDTRTGLMIEEDGDKNRTLRFKSVRRSNPLLLAMQRNRLAELDGSDDGGGGGDDDEYGTVEGVGPTSIMSGPGKPDRNFSQPKRGGHDQDLIEQLQAFAVPEHPTLRGPRLMKRPTDWGLLEPSVASEIPTIDPKSVTLGRQRDRPTVDKGDWEYVGVGNDGESDRNDPELDRAIRRQATEGWEPDNDLSYGAAGADAARRAHNPQDDSDVDDCLRFASSVATFKAERGVGPRPALDDYLGVDGGNAAADGRARRGIPEWWDGDDGEYLAMDGAAIKAERARRGLPEAWDGGDDDEYLGVDGAALARARRGIPEWWDGGDGEYLAMDGAAIKAERARRGLPEAWDGDGDGEYLETDGTLSKLAAARKQKQARLQKLRNRISRNIKAMSLTIDPDDDLSYLGLDGAVGDEYLGVDGAVLARARRGIPEWWDGDVDEYLAMDGHAVHAERARRGLPDLWEGGDADDGDEYLGVDGAEAATISQARRGIPEWWDGDDEEYLAMDGYAIQAERARRGLPDPWESGGGDEYMDALGYGGDEYLVTSGGGGATMQAHRAHQGDSDEYLLTTGKGDGGSSKQQRHQGGAKSKTRLDRLRQRIQKAQSKLIEGDGDDDFSYQQGPDTIEEYAAVEPAAVSRANLGFSTIFGAAMGETSTEGAAIVDDEYLATEGAAIEDDDYLPVDGFTAFPAGTLIEDDEYLPVDGVDAPVKDNEYLPVDGVGARMTSDEYLPVDGLTAAGRPSLHPELSDFEHQLLGVGSSGSDRPVSQSTLEQYIGAEQLGLESLPEMSELLSKDRSSTQNHVLPESFFGMREAGVTDFDMGSGDNGTAGGAAVVTLPTESTGTILKATAGKSMGAPLPSEMKLMTGVSKRK